MGRKQLVDIGAASNALKVAVRISRASRMLLARRVSQKMTAVCPERLHVETSSNRPMHTRRNLWVLLLDRVRWSTLP